MRRRVTLLLLAGLLALPGVAIAPAFAQEEQTPTDLWKQYPLEEGSQPDSAVPGDDNSPRATEPERNAPKADSGSDDGGGSSLVPFVAVGAGALGAAALLLWVVPARRRRRREAGPESPAQQPAEIPSAPARPAPGAAPLGLAARASKTTNGAGREADNGVAPDLPAKAENGVAPDLPAKASERAAADSHKAPRQADPATRNGTANGGPTPAPPEAEPEPTPQKPKPRKAEPKPRTVEPARPEPDLPVAGPPAVPAAPSSPAVAGEPKPSAQPFRGRKLPASASAPAPATAPKAEPGVRALGYTTVPDGDDANSPRLREEARQIQEACQRHGISLSKLVRDLERQSGPDLRRPGLTYALESLEAGEFECLVVPRLDRLTRSAANLGALIRLLDERDARLIVVDIDLDTASDEGRLAADALVKVGGLERKRLEQRTRKGLEAARDRRRSSGRPAVADRPSLKQRIADMRASGMTLQAIADTLNDEGIPTVRGGAEWRPSSVQAAAGYKRPSRRSRAAGSPPKK
jgi:DNA invertase Pin-like site-specific DNA recombinase